MECVDNVLLFTDILFSAVINGSESMVMFAANEEGDVEERRLVLSSG